MLTNLFRFCRAYLPICSSVRTAIHHATNQKKKRLSLRLKTRFDWKLSAREWMLPELWVSLHGFGYWIVDFQNILTLLFHSLLVRYWHVDGRLSRFSWQLIVSIDFSCIWCHHRNAAVGASGTIPNPTHTIYYLILHLIQILIKYKFYLEPKWFLYFFFDRMHVTRPKEPRTLN